MSESGGLYKTPRKKYDNPFRLPSSAELFGFREQEIKENEKKREELKKLTIVQRTNLLKSKIPPLVSQASERRVQTACSTRHGEQLSLSENTSEEEHYTSRAQRQQRRSEFIQQKREIFHIQLLIDKKLSAISHIERDMQNQEAKLANEFRFLDESSQLYKTRTTHAEQELARARKDAEAATCKRVECSKHLKFIRSNLSLLKSDIFKNEDLLEIHKQYNEFIQQITPSEFSNDPMKYFANDPAKLQDMLEKIESENLFLVEQYQTLWESMNRSKSSLQTNLEDINQTYQNVLDQLSTLSSMVEQADQVYGDTDDSQKTRNQIQSDLYDKEIISLNQMIKDCYLICFGKIANVSSLSMLEIIENSLEEMYVQVDELDPNYVSSAQQLKELARREAQRKANQEEKDRKQKQKMLSALKRAQKPIKKRTGRPIYQRTILHKNDKKDDAKLRALQMEEARINKLLYGPTFQPE